MYHCGGQLTNRAPECELDYPHVAHEVNVMTKRTYKIEIGSDTADRMIRSLGIPGLEDARISPVVVYITSDGDSEERDRAIDERRTPNDRDELRYCLEVMVEEEGTFIDYRATDVTGKGWSI